MIEGEERAKIESLVFRHHPCDHATDAYADDAPYGYCVGGCSGRKEHAEYSLAGEPICPACMDAMFRTGNPTLLFALGELAGRVSVLDDMMSRVQAEFREQGVEI